MTKVHFPIATLKTERLAKIWKQYNLQEPEHIREFLHTFSWSVDNSFGVENGRVALLMLVIWQKWVKAKFISQIPL